VFEYPFSLGLASSSREEQTCTVYSLADLGDDPKLGAWVAETIPEMIEPGTWNQAAAGQGGKAKRQLRYFAPSKILVVYHTAAVQAKVATFLQDLRKARPQAQGRATGARHANPVGVVPAGFAAPEVLTTAQPVTPSRSTYPVPAPLKQPKHLFHLIVHYEGEGIVDENVVTMLKSLSGQVSTEESAAKPETPKAGRAPQSNQAFNFIIRYEGEGIIDSTVAKVLKDLYGNGATPTAPVAAGCGLRWRAVPAAATPVVEGTAPVVTGGSPFSVPGPGTPPLVGVLTPTGPVNVQTPNGPVYVPAPLTSGAMPAAGEPVPNPTSLPGVQTPTATNEKQTRPSGSSSR
jgi:hypothetical protein